MNIKRLLIGYTRITRPSTSISTILTSITATVANGDPLNHVDIITLSLLYIGVYLSHSAVNIFNDYFDYRSGLDLYTLKTSFSGGSKTIVNGIVSDKEALYMGLVTIVLAGIIGLYLAFSRGFLVLVLMIIGAAIILGYTSIFTKIGLGEISVYLKGVLVSIGSYYVVYQTIDPISYLIGSLFGSTSLTTLFINSLPDSEIDKLFGRKNLAISVREDKIWLIYLILLLIVSTHILIINLLIKEFITYIFLVPWSIAIFIAITNSLYLRKILFIKYMYYEKIKKLSYVAISNIFAMRIIEFSTTFIFILKNLLLQ